MCYVEICQLKRSKQIMHMIVYVRVFHIHGVSSRGGVESGVGGGVCVCVCV